MLFLRALLVFLAAIACAWFFLALNLSDYFLEQAEDGDEAAIDTALWWDGNNYEALALKADQLLQAGDTEKGRDYLVRSIEANPANARPLLRLSAMELEAGREGLADQMAETAGRLMPVESSVQRQLGYYWLSRQQLDKAVQHFSRSLYGTPGYRDELYPLFLRMIEHEGARQALRPLAMNPPKWWDGYGGFFQYVMSEAEDLDVVRGMVSVQEAGGVQPLSALQRQFYIARLRKEGLLAEAYLVWVNGLRADEMQSLGYLYNGNFEREFSNSGFGWYAWPPKNKGIRITQSSTYGTEGERALRVSFRGDRQRFSHLSQKLFLPTGQYELTGLVRPDKLEARRGLQWRVYCDTGAQGLLGQSETFVGTGDWSPFAFDIEVPGECTGQVLRLHSVGDRDVDHELKGGIWFDDMKIGVKR